MRARWKALPERERWAITIGVGLAVSILFWFLDHSLGYAAAVVFIAIWCRRMPPLPWRLATEAAIVGVFVISWLAGSANGSIPLVLLFAFAFTWIPDAPRRWAVPLGLL